jgi:multiple sugar transport system permease protein
LKEEEMAVVQDNLEAQTKTRAGTLRTFVEELKKARHEKWGNPFGYLFIAPAVILYAVFNVWPMIRGFLMAFTDYRFMYPSTRWDFNGVANFIEMISDQKILNGMMVAIKYGLIQLPGTIIVALILAVLISKVRHFAGFYRWVVYLPVIIPTAVTVLLWKQFLGEKFGFINVNLRALGMVEVPNWLGSVAWALPSTALVDIWRGIGFPTLIFLITIYSINSEIFEAAEIDGASGMQQFWRITLPLLKPAFALVLVLSSGFLGVTESMMLLTAGGPQNSTLSLGLYLYQVAFQLGDLRLGYASSVSLVLGLIAAGLSLLWFNLLRER